MNRTRWLTMLGIILLGTFLRFYHVAAMPLRADEASVVFLAAKDPAEIVQPFVSSDPHMPLYFLILHYWMTLTGDSELAVRFLGVFVGVLFVALVYVLGVQLFPPRRTIAIVGALLAAINPFLIWDGQDVYMYAFLTVTALGSFIAFLRVLQPNARWYHWVAYVIVSALSLFFHYFAAFILISQGVVWLWWTATRRLTFNKVVGWLAAQLAIALIFLPWLLHVLPLLANFTSDFIPSASLIEMLDRTLMVFTVGRADTRMAPAVVEPVTGNILAFGFLVLFVFGYVASSKATREGWTSRLVLTLFLAVPLLSFFSFSILRFPIFDERYVLYLTPAFFLIVARGITYLMESPHHKYLSVVALIFVLLTSSHSLYNYFYVPKFARSPDWYSFIQRLVTDARPGDIIIQNYPDPALPYYLQNRLPRVLLPHTGSEPAEVVTADLDHLTTKYDRIWFQPVPYGTWDTGGIVATWLNRHALETNAYQFRGLQLDLYLPISVALRQAKSVNATLGDQIRLVAFSLNRATGDVIKPGTNLHIVLYWQALDHVERDYTVFVHLYRSDGQLESQQDSQPVRGTFPTSAWTTKDIVVDSYDVPIPPHAPHGTFLLATGMYDQQTMQRLNASDSAGNALAENRVPLMDVTVTGESSQ